MPEQLSFKQKMMKSLYGMGLKNFGPSLLTELKKGGPEWLAFGSALLEGSDYPARKLFLQQLTARGFIEKHTRREELLHLLMTFLRKGMGDEKRAVLKFVEGNLKLFPTDDDAFRSIILALHRDRDSALSSAAEALLPKIGVNLDDRENWRKA